MPTVGVGCSTRLHFDNEHAHAWLTMVRGRKLFVCFPPTDSKYLYSTLQGEECHSPIDPLAPDHSTYPLYAKASPHTVILEEGETIMVPDGWWHYAVSLSPSVTVMRNFWSLVNMEHYVTGQAKLIQNAIAKVKSGK